MNWSDRCIMELTHRHAFENDAHRQRFIDLLDCYAKAPFFTKGLCKCMYLSAWDDEHFMIMLQILNDMTLEGTRNLRMMKDQGEMMELELADGGYELEVMRMSNAFVNNVSYRMPDIGVLDPEGAHIIRQGLRAASYIDELLQDET